MFNILKISVKELEYLGTEGGDFGGEKSDGEWGCGKGGDRGGSFYRISPSHSREMLHGWRSYLPKLFTSIDHNTSFFAICAQVLK